MISTVIFDIGNVLTTYGWLDFIKGQGYSDDYSMRLAKAIMLSPYWCEFDRDVWTYEQIVDAFVSMDPEIEEDIRKCVKDQVKLVTRRDYAIPWIKELKAAGYRVLFLSNFSTYCRKDCDEALDFIPYMDGGVFSFECHLIKPDKEIYQYLIDKYDLIPDECVFIDDMQHNLDTAGVLGINTILFDEYENVRKKLNEMLAI